MDTIQDILLLEIFKNNPTVTELTEKVNLARSSVHNRLIMLEKQELITPPRKKGNARDRTVTELGKQYLLRKGLIKTNEDGYSG